MSEAKMRIKLINGQWRVSVRGPQRGLYLHWLKALECCNRLNKQRASAGSQQ
jgi:hypothetical protein